MKLCKLCKKEIDIQASKCPYCQAHQYWYRNPQIIGFVFPFVFIPALFYVMGIWGNPEYKNYKDYISVVEINRGIDGDNVILNYNIINKSNKKWNDISYQLICQDTNGNIVSTKTEKVHSWVVLPNHSSYITVEVAKKESVKSYMFTILDLSYERW